MAEGVETMSAGKFITLEGVDGAGKSTQLAWLRTHLDERGIRHIVTREPGGTPLGERLREMLLAPPEPTHAETETLLMFAARREHLTRVIIPALQSGTWVVCDRFTDATYAYQCGGSGVAWEKVAALEEWVQGTLQPDLTLLFDLDPQVALSRAQRIKEPDRFEREQFGFHARVREGYLRRAAEHPGRIRLVDASMSLAEVHKILSNILSSICI
jgi:dTMP kinase